ncbi:MAG: spore coat associated protein CotJA [Eubacteriales bacterium]|jgi:hypothetical protein
MSYMEIDYRTPRERIDETLLRRVLDEDRDGQFSRWAYDKPAEGNERDGGCASGRKYCLNMPPDKKDVAGESHTWGLCDFPLAMVYVPLQVWRGLYDPVTGHDRGTIFRELDKPLEVFGGRGGFCRG